MSRRRQNSVQRLLRRTEKKIQRFSDENPAARFAVGAVKLAYNHRDPIGALILASYVVGKVGEVVASEAQELITKGDLQLNPDAIPSIGLAFIMAGLSVMIRETVRIVHLPSDDSKAVIGSNQKTLLIRNLIPAIVGVGTGAQGCAFVSMAATLLMDPRSESIRHIGVPFALVMAGAAAFLHHNSVKEAGGYDGVGAAYGLILHAQRRGQPLSKPPELKL
jgi:hypothetical protein